MWKITEINGITKSEIAQMLAVNLHAYAIAQFQTAICTSSMESSTVLYSTNVVV